MLIYIITENILIGKKLQGLLKNIYNNKYDIHIKESIYALDVQHCIGIILDIDQLANVTDYEFILRFSSIPIVFLSEETSPYNDKVKFSFIDKYELDKNLHMILPKLGIKDTHLQDIYIYIYQQGTHFKILFKNIVYIYHEGNYIHLLDKNHKNYKKRGSVIDIMSFLPNYFLEVSHHAFINSSYIFKYDDKLSLVTLYDDTVIPVSKNKKKEMKKALNFGKE